MKTLILAGVQTFPTSKE